MSNVIPFTFNQTHKVRVFVIDGDPWFVGKDVASILGYADPSRAVRQLCKGGVKRTPLHTGGGTQEVRLISEPDCYRLIMRSNIPGAVEFQDWLFDEVLPEIRSTGRYAGEAGVQQSVPQSFAEALRLAADQADRIERLEHEAIEAMPKVQFHDAVAESADCHTLEETAKMLGTGRNRLARFLREIGAFQPNGTLPYQKFIDRGYFRIIERPWTDSHGETRLSTKTLVTGKGLAKIETKWRESLERSECA
ncbi:phage antirepressor KilAC domain-containing protein [Mariprofundus ferrooxydans]|uniref:phage antirepressor KilAC domain-containing protein n=1 Tax=Mariprofundus ferrooxydans TaxID=314344 RepID=UPI00143214ED|nr:phage antirepressor [Mariprofundus ferrooxydans]